MEVALVHRRRLIDADGSFAIADASPPAFPCDCNVRTVVFCIPRLLTVVAGQGVDLGTLDWTPVRHGVQVWDVGIANRSAEEFRHGDHYWQWGLYQLYPTEFPDDVDFVIGTSDYRKDWNYVQPAVPDGKGGWNGTTWRIRFAMPKDSTGIATLRLAICGDRGGSITVAVNGTVVGGTGPLPQNSVMHRDGIRAVLYERPVAFDATLLRSGENIIELRRGDVRDWTDGILYDYVRLELDSSTTIPPAKP
jgi:rhamnogalacturonan endolyase